MPNVADRRIRKSRRSVGWPSVVAVVVVVLAGCGSDALPVTESVDSMNAPSPSGIPPTTESSTETQPSDPTSAPPFVVDDEPVLDPPSISGSTAVLPLHISENGQALVDQEGSPFLVVGDAAWSMVVQLDQDETDAYLSARRSQGFNTLLVNLIEHHFADDPPRNASGVAPFIDGDFAHPDPAYFDAAHDSIERAAAKGFVVMLTPAYLGYDGGEEGWYEEMVAAGPEKLRSYGRFVGERFADLDNIIWVNGGDFTPPPEGLELVEAVRDGLVEGGAGQLQTAHWSPEHSAIDVEVNWLDLNTTYTYEPVYVKSSRDDAASPLPHLLIESQYEDDQFDNTEQRLRSQTYEAVLTGGIGSVFGNGPIWQFANGWSDALDSTGANDVSRAAKFFHTVQWDEFMPDIQTSMIVPDSGTFGDESVVVAASTSDGSAVVAYVPNERSVTVVLPVPTGVYTVRWYDPTDGTFSAATTSVGADNELSVEHPGPNSASDFDWVLSVVQETGSPG